ncbi:MAG: hypothetical protein JNK25_12410 [Phycisphaerae bacterium]|nr:hypothetical protein [Phycisphaerae bacterium]
MTRRIPVQSVRPGVLIVAGGLLCVGCTGTPQDTSSNRSGVSTVTQREPSPPDGRAELHELARRQHEHPDEQARSIPPPPGISPASVSALEKDDPSYGKAHMGLGPALGSFPPLPEADAVPPPDPEARVQSMKLYASAKAHLAAGRSAQATSDLERAASLDPYSAQVQRALGDAHAVAGKRSAAVSAYRKAVALGLRDPATLGVLGREAVRSRRFDEAVAPLKAARDEELQTPDSVLLAPLGIDLSEALEGAGYLNAARDLLMETLVPLASVPPEGVSAAAAAEVFRRRADLWQRAGDLSLKLDDPRTALTAYERAAAFPTVDPVSIVPRRIYALTRSGRSAEAALFLLDEIHRTEGRLDDRHLSTLAALAKSEAVGASTANSIAAMMREPSATLSASTKSRLARASAACVAPRDARRILLARLESDPADAACIPPLLAVYGDDARGRAEAMLRVVAAAPDLCVEYAEAFVRRGSGVGAALVWLESRKSDPTAALFRAGLLHRIHRDAEALVVLDAAKPATALRPAFESLRAVCAAKAGRWDVAKQARAACFDLDEPKPRRNLAAAELALQNAPAALESWGVKPDTTDIPGWRGVTDCLLGADLSLRAGNSLDAEAWLLAAKSLDVYDERAYDGLLDLYQPGGPLADTAKLTSLARTLRDTLPSSKVARGVAVRERLARGQWAQAAEQLQSMIDADSEHLASVSLLALAWESHIKAEPGAAEAAEAWVRSRMIGREDSPTLAVLLARVLSAGGRADEAVSLLEDKNRSLPNADLLRAREVIIRTRLGEPARAAALTIERLGATPRGIADSIELADAYFNAGLFAEAADTIQGGLPTDIPLTSEQSAAALSVLSAVKVEEVMAGDEVQGEAALRIFDALVSRGVQPAPASYLLRVLVLCARHPGESERLLAAAREAAARTGQPELQMLGRVAQALLDQPDPSAALRFLGAVVNSVRPYNEAFAFNWFRFTAARGDAEDIRFLTTGVVQPAEMVKVIATQFSGDDEHLGTEAEQRSEIAYWAGNGASQFGRENVAEAAYRIALEIKPDHPWALNNLGYMLLENGREFDEAERMITEAYRALPHESSVIDSMGWVRYKQGIFNDTAGPDGLPIRGAASLIREAVDSGVREANYEQADHLGDVLWRIGDHEEAKRRWVQARNLLQVIMTNLNARNPDETPNRARYEASLAQVEAKLRAVEEGKPPPVAPTRAEMGK